MKIPGSGSHMVDAHELAQSLEWDCTECHGNGEVEVSLDKFLEYAREEIFNHMNPSLARYCVLIQTYRYWQRTGTIPCRCRR